MKVQVTRINIPPMSTMGFGWGTNEEGKKVKFAGDWRPMRDLGEAMQQTTSIDPIEVEVESWQILRVDA